MPGKGFTSITVRELTYQKIKKIAEYRGLTITELIEHLVGSYEQGPTMPLRYADNGAIPRRAEAEWAWPGPYVDIVTDPNVDHYRSTAWIRSEQYPKKIGKPQWDPKIEKRIHSDRNFKVEKLFVVSQKAFSATETWKWIGEWLSLRLAYGTQIRVLIVKETVAQAEHIDKKYYDMGIYGNKLVGYLSLDEQSNPLAYFTISLPKEEVNDAIKEFDKLAGLDMSPKEYRDKLFASLEREMEK